MRIIKVYGEHYELYGVTEAGMLRNIIVSIINLMERIINFRRVTEAGILRNIYVVRIMKL